jgi:uncharacterized protein (TIGR03067 family)
MRHGEPWVLLVVLLHIPTLWAADEGLPRQEVVKLAKPATALVETQAGCGSGFCVHPSGFFLTNEHVISALPGGDTVTLILEAGLKTQRLLQAKVVRRDKELDLALLRAQGQHKLPALALGSDEGLAELTELIAFGFPFGTSLAKPGEYPAISVSAGNVTALRRDAKRELHRIQLDAVLNPGNSGGPVLDRKGQVVGVVVSGIRGAGINMAIPVSHVRRFLARPEIVLDVPAIGPHNQQELVELKAAALALASPPLPLELELVLTQDGGAERRYQMKPAGDWHTVKAVPFPNPKEKGMLRLEVKYSDGSVSGLAEDRKLSVDKQVVQLSAVRHVRLGATPEVLLKNGKKLAGALTDLEPLTVKLGGSALSLKLANAVEVEVTAAAPSSSVGCLVIARQEGKEVGRHYSLLTLQGAPGTTTETEGAKNDLKALRGRWVMDRMEVEGKPIFDAERRGAHFDGTAWSLTFDGTQQSSATIILDPAQSPRAIDIQWTSGAASGLRSLGIYRFTEDGALEICWNQARGPNKDRRPKVFTTKVELGAGSVLYVYRRPEPK